MRPTSVLCDVIMLTNHNATAAADSLIVDGWMMTSSSMRYWFMTSLLYVFLPICLFYLSTWFWELKCLQQRDFSSPLPLPGGKMGFPFVGEMFHFLLKGPKYQRKRIKEFGKIYRTHMFFRPTIVVVGSENVRKILLGEGQLVRAYWPSTTRRILGTNGMVNGDIGTHTYIKRLALKAFSPKYMHNYSSIIQSALSIHLQNWRELDSIEILEECKQMVSKIMMTILLGIDQNDPDLQIYIRAADDIINSILTLPLDLPGFSFRKGLQAQKLIFEKLESKLRSKFEETDQDLLEESSSSSAPDSVLLTILKLARSEGPTEKISLLNLQNISLEFIFAGTQSLQCASSLMIVHLCQNPHIVERVREEIREHGLWDTPLTEIGHAKFQELKFSNAVVDETLRVTPTIPGAIRIALKTFELGGYQIPKGWQIMYSIRLTHEDEAGKVLQNGPDCSFDPYEYFHCPCQSNPTTGSNNCEDRKCSGNASRYGYVPFGRGSRMCAGKNYGLLFLRILLFELARSCDVSMATPLKIIDKPMTKPHQSVRVRVVGHDEPL